MKNSLNKSIIERYSRQIVLKDVGVVGQKAIINSKVLITAGIGPFGILLFEENLDNNSLQPPQAGRIPNAASVNPIYDSICA